MIHSKTITVAAIGAIAFSLFSFLSSPASSRSIPPNIYIGEISAFGNSGLFEIEGDPRVKAQAPTRVLFRLWGIDLTSEELVTAAKDAKFTCTVRGNVESKTRGIIQIVSCESESILDLSEKLIFEGIGNVICAEMNQLVDKCK